MSFHRPQQQAVKMRRRFPLAIALLVVVFVVLTSTAVYGLSHITLSTKPKATASTSSSSHVISTSQSGGTPVPPASPAVNYCAGNTLSQNVIVNISKQHLWACEDTSVKYDSPVVTGMESYPADLTPVGTYHIYEKQTDIHLKGCDSTGCWDDPVTYWEPWLSNQYGIYGFHDATWRNPSQFGKVNIYAPETAAVVGSHGCVELPLATAKWLYNWSSVGTTVTIQS